MPLLTGTVLSGAYGIGKSLGINLGGVGDFLGLGGGGNRAQEEYESFEGSDQLAALIASFGNASQEDGVRVARIVRDLVESDPDIPLRELEIHIDQELGYAANADDNTGFTWQNLRPLLKNLKQQAASSPDGYLPSGAAYSAAGVSTAGLEWPMIVAIVGIIASILYYKFQP